MYISPISQRGNMQAFQTKPQGKQRQRIPDMQLNIDAIQTTTNIPDGMTMHELQQATLQDEHLEHLNEHIIQGWPENRYQIPQDMRTYWLF